MLGFLPPSSSAIFFILMLADCMIFLPVSSPPVKEIRSTSLLSDNSAPTECPGPSTKLTTPLGIPASSINSNTFIVRSEEHTSELQSRGHLVCRLLLEKKKTSANAPQIKRPQ